MSRLSIISALACAFALSLAAADNTDTAAPADKTNPFAKAAAAADKAAAGANKQAGAGGRQRPQRPNAAAAKDAKDAKDAKGKALAKDDFKDAKDDKAAKKDAAPKEPSKDDDYVETVLGDLIYGKIHKEQDDCVIMLLHDDSARIRVPREKIKTLNYSMKTRLNALEKNDYVGQYKVGLWAMDRNMYPEAISLFEKLKGIRAKAGTPAKEEDEDDDIDRDAAEKIPDDIGKQLGKAYNERSQFDKALENYNEYLKGHPEDTEIAAVAKALDEKVNPKKDDPAAAANDQVKPKHVDGLEADGQWLAEVKGWDNANPCTAQFTQDKDGNKMMVIQSDGGPKDKIAFSRYGQPLNLTDCTDMVFKAFNDGDKPVNMSIAFVNAEGDFHETKQTRIMPKQWINMSYKIEGKVFKSNRNDFKAYDQELKGKEHVSRITFMVYDQRPVKLFVDSLFFK
ncbi:MAG TPA: hypothetical protein VKX17_25295 [Planctomycetota bacterium]|nr:hypothetical protein [Planctomycetota bacterium]